jgi:hypothetical protein
MRKGHAPRLRLRMVCGGGRTASRVRALGGNEKLLSVARESVGPEIVGRGDLMRDACTRGTSLISLQRVTCLE